jgi:hypothetical protein
MPISKNLAANMAATNNVLTFNGGADHDTIGVHNDSNNNGNVYPLTATQLIVQNRIGFPSFAAFFPHTGVEETTVDAGPQSDTFLLNSTATGTYYDFDSGSGAITDFFAIGSPLAPNSITSLIRGGVRISGAGGADTIDIYNNSDTIGRTLHIENGFIGRQPGDNLFGPGGCLEYVGIAGPLTVRLGSGSDIVYAAPHAVTPITVQGNNPTSAPGDTLNLELATAENYVVNGTPTNGSVTSTNLMTLNYTGFETGPLITTSPDLPGDFGRDGVVDAADYVVWRKMLGMSVPHAFSGADGSGNYVIGPEDYDIWRAHFGNTLPPPGAGSGTGQASSIVSQELQAEAVSKRIVPADQDGESPAETMSASAITDAAAARANSFAAIETRSPGHDSSSRLRRTPHRHQVAGSSDDDLLRLLAIDRVWRSLRQDSFADDSGNGEHRADDDVSESEIDEPLVVAFAVRRGARTCTLPG